MWEEGNCWLCRHDGGNSAKISGTKNIWSKFTQAFLYNGRVSSTHLLQNPSEPHTLILNTETVHSSETSDQILLFLNLYIAIVCTAGQAQRVPGG